MIVTPEGLTLAYEVMSGNTSDKTTLRDFIRRIEAQYGKAGRTWVMDRGIPTEAVLADMRASETPMRYLVGTPRGRLSQLEQEFLTKPWAQVRDTVQVPWPPPHPCALVRRLEVGRRIALEPSTTVTR